MYYRDIFSIYLEKVGAGATSGDLNLYASTNILDAVTLVNQILGN